MGYPSYADVPLLQLLPSGLIAYRPESGLLVEECCCQPPSPALCGYPICDDLPLPRAIYVTLSGVTTGGIYDCDACNSLNRRHKLIILDQENGQTNGCKWDIREGYDTSIGTPAGTNPPMICNSPSPPPPTGPQNMRMRVQIAGGSYVYPGRRVLYAQVLMGLGGSLETWNFEKDLGPLTNTPQVPCRGFHTLVNASAPISDAAVGFCNFSSASLIVEIP